jgi:hypothetical protein
MRLLAPVSSLSTTVGLLPVSSARMREYARAWFWFVAMTSPAASGRCRLTSVSRRSALRSTELIHSPFGSSAVRQACAVMSAVSGSLSEAAISSPADVRQRIGPP